MKAPPFFFGALLVCLLGLQSVPTTVPSSPPYNLRDDAPAHVREFYERAVEWRLKQISATRTEIEAARRATKDAADRRKFPKELDRIREGNRAASRLAAAELKLVQVEAPDYLTTSDQNLVVWPPSDRSVFSASLAVVIRADIGDGRSLVRFFNVRNAREDELGRVRVRQSGSANSVDPSGRGFEWPKVEEVLGEAVVSGLPDTIVDGATYADEVRFFADGRATVKLGDDSRTFVSASLFDLESWLVKPTDDAK